MLPHLFGVCAMASLFFLYQQKSRKGIIKFKLSADVFWILHYFCLGAVAGMIPNFVGIFRELVFMQRGKRKWASTPLWVVLFIAFNFTLGILSYENAYDMIPIVASSLVTVSLWLNNPNLTKILSLPVSTAFLIYDAFVASYMGIVNESFAIISIILYFLKILWKRKEGINMKSKLFQVDCVTEKQPTVALGAPIEHPVKTISQDVSHEAIAKGDAFANEIAERFVGDFEKPEDKMAHVSTFLVADGYVYMTYYANTKDPDEDPRNQTARLVYAPLDDMENKTFLDIQTTGHEVGGRVIDMVYDTILMQKDQDTVFVMWTARTEGNYYRFYCPFSLTEKKLGEIGVNKIKVGDITNDFSVSGIQSAFAESGIPIKKMYSDIGIMQKLSSRVENGEVYYYSGTYSGDFTCVIKSRDLITWEYVSQPDFVNDSKWENATYVLDDKVYYFVRQQNENPCGFLTCYDLNTGAWTRPVEIQDCQSRGDFIYYRGSLYLFHAPIDREHIGIVRIDTAQPERSEVVLQAKMHTSCFYPFVQYYQNSELAMSYTVARQHIRLAEFDLSKYL